MKEQKFTVGRSEGATLRTDMKQGRKEERMEGKGREGTYLIIDYKLSVGRADAELA